MPLYTAAPQPSTTTGTSSFRTIADTPGTALYKFPLLGQPRIMARTDYIVHGKCDMTVFLTAAKKNGEEGHVFCARTTDGGKSWDFVSWLGPEPDGYSIMPSTVVLSPNKWLTAIRRKEGPQHWIEAYLSEDRSKN